MKKIIHKLINNNYINLSLYRIYCLRKLFFITFLICLSLSFLIIYLTPPNYIFTSTIKIGNIGDDLIEPVKTSRVRIIHSIIPKIRNLYEEQNIDTLENINVKVIINSSNDIILKSKGIINNSNNHYLFHESIINSLIIDHANIAKKKILINIDDYINSLNKIDIIDISLIKYENFKKNNNIGAELSSENFLNDFISLYISEKIDENINLKKQLVNKVNKEFKLYQYFSTTSSETFKISLSTEGFSVYFQILFSIIICLIITSLFCLYFGHIKKIDP
jgi:hypothetical protein